MREIMGSLTLTRTLPQFPSLPHPVLIESRSRSYSPRRPYVHSPPSTPSPTIVATALPPVSDVVMKQEEKPQPLWKRLSCMA
ncbi:hypothetical protein PILCRDRAFT_393667 [Piloderma croceum F 1598]|uniref:Uncharacterized protein n=1 Tax=Piloderma croceum (strain F 1598) TaxID=765440 RepID=A0A0C3FKW3_PILCF|nr:hypothetical protein PILCRDRAFT_393667 [Piloderma croceum F 1598]